MARRASITALLLVALGAGALLLACEAATSDAPVDGDAPARADARQRAAPEEVRALEEAPSGAASVVPPPAAPAGSPPASPGVSPPAAPSSDVAAPVPEVASTEAAGDGSSREAGELYKHARGGCEVRVLRAPKAAVATSWPEAYRLAAAPVEEHVEPIVEAGAARDALCPEGCPKGHPQAVVLPPETRDLVSGGFVTSRADGRIEVIAEVTMGMRVWHCEPELEASPARRHHAHLWTREVRVEESDADGNDCDAMIDDDCMVGCFHDVRRDVDLLDDGVHAPLLVERVTTETAVDGPSKPAIELEFADGRLRVHGCGASFVTTLASGSRRSR